MLGLFVSAFGLIFLAELPDKTVLATVVLATRKHPLAVFIGVAVAFVVQSALAAALGSLFGLLPAQAVRLGAGFLFLSFAVVMWREREESGEVRIQGRAADFSNEIWTSFMVIFLAEWGDLTQLATAALVAKHGHPFIVFFAATAALWSVSGLAILVGHNARRSFHPHHLQKASAVMFALVGLVCLFR